MKKFSKILAVVLTAILLCGIMAMVISADSTISQVSASSGVTDLSFEDGGSFSVSDPKFTTIQSKNVSFGSNKYSQMSGLGDGSFCGDVTTPIYYVNIMNGDYLTVDFDFTADKYVNTATNTLLTVDEYEALSDEDKALCNPSYVAGRFYWEVELFQGDYNASIQIRQKDGKWYLTDNQRLYYYPLPEKANEWTHITYFYKLGTTVTYYTDSSLMETAQCSFYEFRKMVNSGFDSSLLKSVNISDTECHIYINGEYAFELATFTSQKNDTKLYSDYTGTGRIKYGRVRTGYDSVASNVQIPFSIGLDNYNSLLYVSGYEGTIVEAAERLDNLFYCTDTTFTAGYKYPEGTSYKAKLTNPDGSTGNYFLPVAAANAAQNNAVVELFADSNFPVTPKTQFAVKHNGYNFSVAGDSGYLLSEHADADKYSVRRALYSDYADVVWDFEGELYDVTRSLSGTTPTYLGDTSFVNGIMPGDKYRIFKGWSTDPAATAVTEIPVLSAGEELWLYPVYEIYDTAYLVLDANGMLFEYNGSYECYANLATIGAVVSAAPSGSTVTLLSDVDMSVSAPFVFNKAADIAIDLNGYDMTFGLDGVSKATYLFTLNVDGVNLSIYSSKPGSEILAYSTGANGAVNDSAALFSVLAACSVTVGNGEDDLIVNANTLYSANASIGKVSLTLNGGTYVSEASSYAGLIAVNATDKVTFVLDINDATLYHKNMVFKNEGDFKTEATIDNSVIMKPAGGVIGYVIGAVNEGSTYVLTNTTVVGKLIADIGKGKIVLGEGTKYTFDTSKVKNTVLELATGCESTAVSEPITVEYSSYDISFAEGGFTVNAATRTISDTIKTVIVKTATEETPGGEVVTPENPEVNTPENNEPAPTVSAVDNVRASKTLYVHDAPVSVTANATETADNTAPASFKSLTEVAIVPTKDEEKMA